MAGSIIPTIRAPLALVMPVVSMIICGVAYYLGRLARCAILVDLRSMGSLHIKNTCLRVFSFLLLWYWCAAMHFMRLVKM